MYHISRGSRLTIRTCLYSFPRLSRLGKLLLWCQLRGVDLDGVEDTRLVAENKTGGQCETVNSPSDYLAGAPGNAGKSSLDIWNSEEWSDGCFTIPTARGDVSH